MRECWVNVYVLPTGVHALGMPEPALSSSLVAAGHVRAVRGFGPAYRLHVRLKPEPATYADKLSEGFARADLLLLAKAVLAARR